MFHVIGSMVKKSGCPAGQRKVNGKCQGLKKTKDKFRRGEKVLYYGSWGSKDPVIAKIVDISTKKGRRTYDIKIPGQKTERWGYAYQFKKIPKKPRR